MEQIPNNQTFEMWLEGHLSSQPKTKEIAGTIFNYVDGGTNAVDNAGLDETKKKQILIIIKEAASQILEIDDTDALSDSSQNKKRGLYKSATDRINNIIESAL